MPSSSHRSETGTFTAKYRDGAGVVIEKATGCRDETAARSVLGEMERRAELVKSKVLTAAEDAVADHQGTPLVEHFLAFIDHQKAKGVSPVRVNNTRTQLRRVADDCGFRRLDQLNSAKMENWLVRQEAAGMSGGGQSTFTPYGTRSEHT